MIPFKHTLHTDGSGYWSDEDRAVKTTTLAVPYIDDEEEFGELRIYFDTKTWNCNDHGLIYTDRKFMSELHDALIAAGFSEDAAGDVDYSEQGMQGDNFVSCDVGELFLQDWKLFTEPLYKMVKEHKVVDKAAA